jgi:ferredoxin
LADGICFEMDEDHFEEDDEGYALVKGGTLDGEVSIGEFDDDGYDAVKEAADSCPGECIYVEKLE